MDLVTKIVNNIDFRRDKKGFTVDKLSKVAEIPMSTIVKIRQKGVKDIRVSTLIALAKALDCTLDDLVK